MPSYKIHVHYLNFYETTLKMYILLLSPHSSLCPKTEVPGSTIPSPYRADMTRNS